MKTNYVAMDFYKKLKVGKSSSNDNLTDSILSEVERKLTDMQPVIHDSTADKSKVQKTISEIRTQVDALKNLGGTVSVEQQEKIKDISRRYREIAVKYSTISDVSGTALKSPKVFRKKLPEVSKEPVPIPQNKVALVEVEEKLKSMRQKRLDRLSVFVAEQSKLSEERSNRGNDTEEIEDAIKSIQKTEIEKKVILKSVVEENILRNKVIKEEVDNVKNSPKIGRSRSNESTDKFKNSKSSTLKFINKFNCTIPTDSSTEDLTKDIYEKPASVSDTSEVQQHKDICVNLKPTEQVTSEETVSNVRTSLDDLNPLLSPIGKQRKAVYLYEHECQFLEKEKRSSLPPLSTFGKDMPKENTPKKGDLKPKIHTYENSNIIVKSDSKPSTIESVEKIVNKETNVASQGFVKTKVSNFYENREIIEKQSSNRSSTKSLDLISEDENTVVSNNINNVRTLVKEKDKSTNSIEKVGKNKSEDEQKKYYHEDKNKTREIGKLPKLNIKSGTSSRRKLNRNNADFKPIPQSPLKSPLPLPRRNNHAERVLKKMQRNWESLNEILENDSDVDCDEIEDLKKTWEEASVLLTEYKKNITKLDKKGKEEVDIEKLSNIKSQLKIVQEDIKTFKGLRRDISYVQMTNRLSNYFLDISKMHFSDDISKCEKHAVLDDIDKYVKILESKVIKNETLLMEILDEQARSIGTNYLCITKV